MEIRGVSISSNTNNKEKTQSSQQTSSSTPGSRGSNSSSSRNNVRYYAMVNKFPDDVAKHCFMSGVSNNEAVFVRHIFEKFASLSSAEEGSQSSTSGTGGTAMARSAILNSRNDMDKNFKITLPQAESVLEKLLEEKWLAYENPANGTARRTSNTAKIILAPRTYLELSYFLESSGMEQDNMPQLIYHTNT